MSANPFFDPSLPKRHRSTRRFKRFTAVSVLMTLAFLFFFLFDMVRTAAPAVWQAYVKVDVTYNEQTLRFTRKAVDKKYGKIVSRAWLRTIPKQVDAEPALMNTTVALWVLADDQVDQYMKGHHHKLKPKEVTTVENMKENGDIELRFNAVFLARGIPKYPKTPGFSRL